MIAKITANEITTQQEFVAWVKLLIEDKKMYLNHDLSLDNIATRLREDGSGFFEVSDFFSKQEFENYLNELRITHAAILFLGNNSHLFSMEKIGMESGFDSYDSFCKTSQQLTGMLPEEIRKFVRLRNSLKGVFLEELKMKKVQMG